MAATPSSSPPLSSGPTPPPGFKTVEEILNLPSDQVKVGPLHNVIGFVTDYQPPVRTRGSDFKCTIEIKDHSVQYTSVGMKVIIFWPEDQMPKISGPKDAVLIRKAKVQMWNGSISMLANKASEFHILPYSQFPRSLAEMSKAPWRTTPALVRKPTADETKYVAVASNGIGEMGIPSSQEFQIKAAQAMNVKDKFSLLKDVIPGRFYDILGEVVRIFDGTAGRVTVYLSDYTANSSFYNYSWDDNQESAIRERDEYGNYKSKPNAAKDWQGPYGKMTIQLTLYDAHAERVRENIKVDQWIFLKNVQMKFGKEGNCLEGFLRGDPNQYENAVRVEVMQQKEEKDENDTRWKDAVRRKHEWWRRFKKQRETLRQALQDEVAGTGEKHKLDTEPKKNNSKKRRQERRAAAAEKFAAVEAKAVERLDLNENIRCGYPDLPTLRLSRLLQPQSFLLRSDDSQDVILPFVVANYRANVRVVGYFPPKLEDFAVGRRVSEYDMLSDYSGGEDSDPEEFYRSWKSGKGAPAKVWEWRFALEVIDASSKNSTEKMWLMVDNAAAQGLLDLDATNLRSREGRDTLRDLKERMCILWGDLEEQKSALAPPDSTAEIRPSSSTSDTLSVSSPASMKTGGQPNVDSDDDENQLIKRVPAKVSMGHVLKERDLNVGLGTDSSKVDQPDTDHPIIHNKAFTCCIKQYGVKVKEEDPSKANAGGGKRWERKFGLFGVVIQ